MRLENSIKRSGIKFSDLLSYVSRATVGAKPSGKSDCESIGEGVVNLSFTYLRDDIDRYACFCYNRNDRILRRKIKANGMHNK